MARIAGLKLIKNTSGKVTHATLSMKHHAKIIEDMIDHQLMAEARKGEFEPWEDAKKYLEGVAKRKEKKKRNA